MFNLKFKEFSSLAKRAQIIPLCKEINIGDETTISVITKLGLIGQPHVLLESAKGQTKLARYSYIGFAPEVIFKTKGNRIERKQAGQEKIYFMDPFMALKELMSEYTAERIAGLPEFYGGAMGYFSYDMGRLFEEMPAIAADDLALPESFFMLANNVLCFDNLAGKIKIIVNVHPIKFLNLNEAYDWGIEEIERIESLLQNKKNIDKIKIEESAWQKKQLPECNVTKDQFAEMVVKAKEYIVAGDIFQVNLSLRLGQKLNTDAFNLYKVLREINPSPYMCFINFEELQIVGSSPELLVRLRDGWAETRPIAGTRRRGKDRKEDLALANELIHNEKERAEHVMLVDLERNDLGRVCSYGSVEVNELMVIEEYSHVMHIVSNVRGKLTPQRNRFDLIKACFPGGTITGAPKIRSMEIIEELEPTRRGIYTGSIGFLGYGGEMEMNICIRSVVIKDNIGYVQAGAGIVADSIPEKEYFESMKKAEALLRAMELANQIFNQGRE